jgi:hypothetical protein
MKEMVRAIFAAGLTEHTVAELIDRLLARLSRSRLKPFVRLGRTIRKHRNGILAARRLKLSNARAEALNKGQADRPPRIRIPFRQRRARARSPHLRTGQTHPPTRTRARVTSPTIMPGELRGYDGRGTPRSYEPTRTERTGYARSHLTCGGDRCHGGVSFGGHGPRWGCRGHWRL